MPNKVLNIDFGMYCGPMNVGFMEVYRSPRKHCKNYENHGNIMEMREILYETSENDRISINTQLGTWESLHKTDIVTHITF